MWTSLADSLRRTCPHTSADPRSCIDVHLAGFMLAMSHDSCCATSRSLDRVLCPFAGACRKRRHVYDVNTEVHDPSLDLLNGRLGLRLRPLHEVVGGRVSVAWTRSVQSAKRLNPPSKWAMQVNSLIRSTSWPFQYVVLTPCLANLRLALAFANEPTRLLAVAGSPGRLASLTPARFWEGWNHPAPTRQDTTASIYERKGVGQLAFGRGNAAVHRREQILGRRQSLGQLGVNRPSVPRGVPRRTAPWCRCERNAPRCWPPAAPGRSRSVQDR